ncbi:hypothetical protein M011DRAFT_481861 [Sporormia fimetaria CBS 119925]|uniref:Uncharacterized protein n=1 Tax=Sporormia fimetaria CBS 119925 TaxID=1340428 RepID=A0A6A6UYU5_9PLEO|nr:hypothetical protein M011DRAFT_481861 [Sporormia fimetaria CBS 119925]
MQTKAILTSLLLAAAGTQAAPAIESRQVTSIPVSIYDNNNCVGSIVTTINVPTDGSCFSIAPILTANTDSARIDVPGSIPNGCTVTIFNTSDCKTQGGNLVSFSGTGQCLSFHAPNPIDPFIRAIRTSGNCQ